MRAWRLRLVTRDGSTPRMTRLAIRFITAIVSWLPFGAGYLLILVTPDREAFHDRVSGTFIVHEPS